MESRARSRTLVALGIVLVCVLGTQSAARGGTAYTFQASRDDLTVRWSLESLGNHMQASGIIETDAAPVEAVYLEFVAKDAAGQVVGRSRQTVWWGFDKHTSERFSVQLPGDPRARTYDVRISGYASRVETGHGR